MIEISTLAYWVWLSSLSGVGAVTATALLRHFGTPEKIFLAEAKEYQAVEGLKSLDVSLLKKEKIESANKILASCAEIDCRVLTQQDAEYPDRLRNIYDSPIILYVCGSLPVIDDEPVVAIVGTRHCSPYGLSAADSIGYELAVRGLVVATGLARGIDSAAARGALRGGGRVIGVVGSGLDIIYPRENKALFKDVTRSGALISEYPPGSAALPAHFPARNRIISGVSLGVAIIEAPRRSGALITANRALEQGKDVFTLPANVDAKSSEGSNALLKEGAIPILRGEDIVHEYADMFPDKIKADDHTLSYPHDSRGTGHQRSSRNSGENDVGNAIDVGLKDIDNAPEVEYIDFDEIVNALAGDERIVAAAIGCSVAQVDEIIVNSGLPAQRVMTALTLLELKGYAARENSLYKISNP